MCGNLALITNTPHRQTLVGHPSGLGMCTLKVGSLSGSIGHCQLRSRLRVSRAGNCGVPDANSITCKERMRALGWHVPSAHQIPLFKGSGPGRTEWSPLKCGDQGRAPNCPGLRAVLSGNQIPWLCCGIPRQSRNGRKKGPVKGRRDLNPHLLVPESEFLMDS